MKRDVSMMMDAALAYADDGWRVLPVFEMQGNKCACGDTECPSPGKHPRVKNGAASSDRARVESWWRKMANVQHRLLA